MGSVAMCTSLGWRICPSMAGSMMTGGAGGLFCPSATAPVRRRSVRKRIATLGLHHCPSGHSVTKVARGKGRIAAGMAENLQVGVARAARTAPGALGV